MMPPSNLDFDEGELLSYKSEYSERCMRMALKKNTVPLLKQSEAEFLVVDFFDFCQPLAGFENTSFSTYDYCFYNTRAYKQNMDNFRMVDFLNIPEFLWYGYVDLYFNEMKNKFGDNIILIRLSCSKCYMTIDHRIEQINERLLHFGNAKYNAMIRKLENYIIEKYKLYVVDISQYFIPDEAYNPDTTPVHFEAAYNLVLSNILKEIIQNKPDKRYYDEIPRKIVSELMLRSVSENDFKTIYAERKLPFAENRITDMIFNMCSLDEIIRHRDWIASIYNIDERDILSDQAIWKDAEKDIFIKSVQKEYEEFYSYYYLPQEDRYQLFLDSFEAGDVSKWIKIIKLMSSFDIGYKDAVYYVMQYYTAINDNEGMIKVRCEL